MYTHDGEKQHSATHRETAHRDMDTKGFHIFTPRSKKELEDYFELRWQCLRSPFNMPRGSERDDDDTDAWHVAAKNNNDVCVGGARLHLNANNTAQVRYMMVADGYRRRGIGRAMLQVLEMYALAEGYRHITLNARDEAVPFYLSCGYTKSEATPPNETAIDLPHFVMEKELEKELQES